MRRQGDIAARLEKLRAALKRAEGLPAETVLDRLPMAEVLAVSWNTLRDWLDAHPELEKPELVIRGGQGIAYQFRPAAFIAALIASFETEAEARRTRNRGIQSKAGLTLPDAESAATFEEAKGLVNLTLTVVAAAREQQLYVRAEELTEFIDGYNQRIVGAIMGVRTRADPNGNLPASVRAQVDEFLRQVALDAHAEAERFVKEHRARLQPDGAAGAGRTALDTQLLSKPRRHSRKAARPAQTA